MCNTNEIPHRSKVRELIKISGSFKIAQWPPPYCVYIVITNLINYEK